jgi:putative nucleotidyltransferase with HDIG domain
MRHLVDRTELLTAATRLEPLPDTVIRLATAVSDPDSSVHDLVEIVRTDPVLAATLLRHANSPWSGALRPIIDVASAVLRLGSASVLAVATARAVADRIGHAMPSYGLEAGALWAHAVRTSTVAEVLHGRLARPVPAGVVTAALLHDIGKLVIDDLVAPRGSELLAKAASTEGRSVIAVENDVLGTNHAHIGATVAQYWRLPPSIVEGIAGHHDPALADSTVAWVVSLANDVADDERLVAGTWDAESFAHVSSIGRACAVLDLSHTSLEVAIEEARKRLEHTAGPGGVPARSAAPV